MTLSASSSICRLEMLCSDRGMVVGAGTDRHYIAVLGLEAGPKTSVKHPKTSQGIVITCFIVFPRAVPSPFCLHPIGTDADINGQRNREVGRL